MALFSTKDFDPTTSTVWLEHAIMRTFKSDLRKKLDEAVKEVVDEVLQKTIDELSGEVKFMVEKYRSNMAFEDIIRVMVLDKRNAK